MIDTHIDISEFTAHHGNIATLQFPVSFETDKLAPMVISAHLTCPGSVKDTINNQTVPDIPFLVGLDVEKI